MKQTVLNQLARLEKIIFPTPPKVLFFGTTKELKEWKEPERFNGVVFYGEDELED